MDSATGGVEGGVEAPVAVEYVPAAHSVHALAPDKGEYLPVVHSVQLLAPEEENEPGAQGWGWVCPPVQNFPLGHAVVARVVCSTENDRAERASAAVDWHLDLRPRF